MDVTPLEAIDAAIILGIPVLVTRMVVGLSRPRRVSRLWTFGLPVAAMLAFFLRVSITRNVDDLVPSDDWISAASWIAIVVTQAIATIYQWTPEVLFARWGQTRRRRGNGR